MVKVEDPPASSARRLPVVLNVEIFRGNGRVDGVIQALGRGYLVVGRPRTLRVDDRLVYITPGMRPV